MNNTLSIDFEDWFQVFYGAKYLAVQSWDAQTTEFPRMVHEIIELLSKYDVKATIFMVGWLANKYPNLVNELSNEGHEIASHGYWHKQVTMMSSTEFFNDTKDSKMAIEDAIGKEIIGYRAPGYSITKDNEWAPDIIKQLGFRYDSSLLFSPVNLSTFKSGLIEVAPNAINILNNYLPINGGFVFRALPYSLYKKFMDRLNYSSENLNFYTHSWEIVCSEHRLPIKGVKRFIQYYNTKTVNRKFCRLLKDFKFNSIQNRLLECGVLY